MILKFKLNNNDFPGPEIASCSKPFLSPFDDHYPILAPRAFSVPKAPESTICDLPQ
jgi:hypothetical protein